MKSNQKKQRWAVVGLGRAGQARIKSLRNHPMASLIHVSSRREPSGASFADVLASDVDAVALCRESAHHAADALACIQAGKHVLVEYPLATNVSDARMVLAEAEGFGRVVHVGFLGLRSAWSQRVADVVGSSHIKRVTYSFTAGFGQVPRAEAEKERWGVLILARLHQLIHWFGPLTLVSSQIEELTGGWIVNVDLQTEDRQLIRLMETRCTGLARTRSVRAWRVDQQEIPTPEWKPERGVFAHDTDICIQRIAGHTGTQAHVNAASIIEGLSLAEAIARCAVAVQPGAM